MMNRHENMDGYEWPLAPSHFADAINKAIKPQVLRFKRSWDSKLFPVSFVIDGDRWSDDQYSWEVTGDRMIGIRDRKSGLQIRVINAQEWRRLWYEYHDGNSWHEVKHGMSLVDKEES